jgi:hypothetical protein
MKSLSKHTVTMAGLLLLLLPQNPCQMGKATGNSSNSDFLKNIRKIYLQYFIFYLLLLPYPNTKAYKGNTKVTVNFKVLPYLYLRMVQNIQLNIR